MNQGVLGSLVDGLMRVKRAPWLVISPKPLNGDPHYEIAPMLWHRWDEIADNVRFGVQRRFYALVDAAGFDEDRARGYVVCRYTWRQVTRRPHWVANNVREVLALQAPRVLSREAVDM